jgi:hypothetical protein
MVASVIPVERVFVNLVGVKLVLLQSISIKANHFSVYKKKKGDLDCTQPLCGSLYEDSRPQRKPGEDCACDLG